MIKTPNLVRNIRNTRLAATDPLTSQDFERVVREKERKWLILK